MKSLLEFMNRDRLKKHKLVDPFSDDKRWKPSEKVDGWYYAEINDLEWNLEYKEDKEIYLVHAEDDIWHAVTDGNWLCIWGEEYNWVFAINRYHMKNNKTEECESWVIVPLFGKLEDHLTEPEYIISHALKDPVEYISKNKKYSVTPVSIQVPEEVYHIVDKINRDFPNTYY